MVLHHVVTKLANTYLSGPRFSLKRLAEEFKLEMKTAV
uniref:Uncharacterized protein n=1 Tax=Rhizophora mucronata TaxID=61149 RepID=A0A2P2PBL0_RHIMU